MTKRDKPIVMRILRNVPEFNRADIVIAEEVIDDYLDKFTRSGYHIWVAEIDTKVVGYICVGPAPLTTGTWDIYWIAVNPDSQNRGIGKELMAFSEHKIKDEGGRLVLIETSAKLSYSRTCRFYCSLGYEIIAQIPDYYAENEDKIILQKRINSHHPDVLGNSKHSYSCS